MSIPKTPIKPIGYYEGYNPAFSDQNNVQIHPLQIARDLTEFYEMKKRQDECGKTGHDEGCSGFAECCGTQNDFCSKCGADLTKGATHEA